MKRLSWYFVAFAGLALWSSLCLADSNDFRPVRISYALERGAGGKAAHEGEAVRLVGVATIDSGTFYSDKDKIFIQDEDSGICLFSRTALPPIKVGDRLEAMGRISMYAGTIELVTKAVSVIGRTNPPTPLNVNPDELLSRKLAGRLVHTEGLVLGVFAQRNGVNVSVAASQGVLRLRLTKKQKSGFPADFFARGATLGITGIASQYDNEPPFNSGWQILPRDPQDVVLLHSPPLFTRKEALLGLGAVGCLTLIAVAWTLTLQRQVRVKTLEYRKAADSLARTLATLTESQERYRSLFERNLAGVYRLTHDGRLLEANEACSKILGYSSPAEMQGQDVCQRHLDRAERDDLLARLQQHRLVSNYELRLHRKDGSAIWVLLNMALAADASTGDVVIEGTLIDITERKQELDDQLRQSQKMEAVGRLAGGVAHDFNNLLTAILGYSDVLRGELGDGHPASDSVEEIRKAGERAAALTRQLLAFSRKQILTLEILDLNTLVANIGKMLRRLIGEDIQLSFSLDAGLGPVKADAGQIEQVLTNLVVNARDAMPTGGEIRIETANVELDHAYSREHAWLVKPGSYVLLSVSDTGIGMDAETMSHIFEPFFTTKDKSKGTGLGLATVYGIVKQSGGYISVHSELASGTTFKIYLPRVEAEATRSKPDIEEKVAAAGTETILLVEDEEGVRRLSRQVLENCGYSVLAASDGEEALQLVAERDNPIDLVLADVVMPGMGGRSLADRLAPIQPAMKVVYMSGYTDGAIARHGVLEEHTHFLPKPFTPDALARKVREVLDA